MKVSKGLYILLGSVIAEEWKIVDLKTGWQLTSFSLIGVVNTLIHLLIVIGLIELLEIMPVLANGMAFICANIFSFLANSRWSFQSALTGRRYLRFLMVSLLGLAISFITVAISELAQWHYLAGVFLSFIFLPLITFVAHRNWTWKT